MLIWHINDQTSISLTADHERIERALRRVLAGRSTVLEPDQNEPPPSAIVQCQLQLIDDEIEPPPGIPHFVDERLGPPSMVGNVAVYGEPRGLTLEKTLIYFNRVALARFEAADRQTGGRPVCVLTISTAIFGTGKFEDVIFTALAPLLRRAGWALVHAFAAAAPAAPTIGESPRVVLFVGQSGSGKTTTGLNLLLNGWRLLGNDIVLLSTQANEVWGWPTPGIVSIRRPTLALLPALNQLGQSDEHGLQVTSEVVGRWGEAAPIRQIYFPQIEAQPPTQRRPLSKGVALAKLMEESVDRWDQETLDWQLDLLSRLTHQAETYTLHLGQDMSQPPQIV